MTHIRNESVKTVISVMAFFGIIALSALILGATGRAEGSPKDVQPPIVEAVVEEVQSAITAPPTTTPEQGVKDNMESLPPSEAWAFNNYFLSAEEKVAFQMFLMDPEERDSFVDFITPKTPTGAPITSGGGMICPFPGSSFTNSYGAPRSGGRGHRGVDMMGPYGAPIYAPVSGTVTHGSDGLGGLHFKMNGDDGRYYYGAHLSGYGAGGYVSAGTVIGYNGTSGNAQGAHLHFEIHIGGAPVNPYNYTAAAC